MYNFIGFSDVSNEKINGVVSTVPKETVVHIRTECPQNGLTISACGREGKIILYISRSSNVGRDVYDEIIEIESGNCDNAFIKCGSRRRRQSLELERIYIAIEGVEENNEYELNATTGDTSTPKGKQLHYNVLNALSLTVTYNMLVNIGTKYFCCKKASCLMYTYI